MSAEWFEIFARCRHLLGSGEEEEGKHYAVLAILGEEDMDELPLGPGTGLAWRDLVEDMGSGRLLQQEDVGEIENSSHRGLGRPEEGIEDAEALSSPPFAPCVIQRSWGG